MSQFKILLITALLIFTLVVANKANALDDIVFSGKVINISGNKVTILIFGPSCKGFHKFLVPDGNKLQKGKMINFIVYGDCKSEGAPIRIFTLKDMTNEK